MSGFIPSPTVNRSRSRIRWSQASQPEDMVEPFLVHYPSRDGKWTISALVYVPYNMARSGQNAAVVYVHGGPASQSVNSFSRIIQHMVNQGYMVIAPNYRGSTGYGKEFLHANLFDMGGGDLQDVLAAADFIKQTGYLDPKKLVLMGGSYGGYMTMMGVTKAPDVWAAGVPIVPFVNWFTEIANEDPVLQQSDLATMGDPEKNKDLFHDRSPIFFVDQIKAPLLLLAGGNDPRCPKEEAQQVVDAVKKRGGVAEYKVYENEGHGFARVENLIDAYKRVSEFLKAQSPASKLRLLAHRVIMWARSPPTTWGRAPSPVLVGAKLADLCRDDKSELRSTRTGEGARPHVASGSYFFTNFPKKSPGVPVRTLRLLRHFIAGSQIHTRALDRRVEVEGLIHVITGLDGSVASPSRTASSCHQDSDLPSAIPLRCTKPERPAG